jgi:methyl-accepting chemotaxis protein
MILKTRAIQTKLAIGFALGPIILAIIGWIAYSNTQSLLDRFEGRRHTFEVLQQIEVVQERLVDAQTGQNFYVMTGNERYLEPYRAANASVTAALTKLAELTRDNSRHQTRIQTIAGLARQRLDDLSDTIAARRDKGFEVALELVQAGRGKQLMDDVRGQLDQMSAESLELLRQRAAEADSIARQTFNSIFYGTIGCFLLLGFVGFVTTRSITVPVRRAVDTLSSMSAEILAGTTQQAAGMREQSSAVSETVSTVDEVLQTAEQAAQRAQLVSSSAQRAAEAGLAGRTAVEESVSAMSTIKDQTGSIAESILTLAEQAQAIGEIIASVNDIAEQTNVLSLNAAIEASRAGEHGRGFSVVAIEIKALAEQSKKATAQVRQILGEIQNATSAAVMVTEQGSKSVNSAIKTVNEAGSTIRTLTDTVNEAAQTAAQIAASSGQQVTGMHQIHQAMKHINQASNQNLASTRQAEQAAQNLNHLGVSLKEMVTG